MSSGYDPLLTGFLFSIRKDKFAGKEKAAFFGAKVFPPVKEKEELEEKE
jgi:hypothetical protein